MDFVEQYYDKWQFPRIFPSNPGNKPVPKKKPTTKYTRIRVRVKKKQAPFTRILDIVLRSKPAQALNYYRFNVCRQNKSFFKAKILANIKMCIY